MMSTSLMGQSGPLSTFAGFGNLAGAISGFYELTGWPDRAPAGPFLAYTDYVAPKYSVAALLAALDWRRRIRLRAAPRPVPGRGLDPLPGPGHPRPRRQRDEPDADGQRRPVPPPPRRAPLRRRRRAGWRSPARPTRSGRRWRRSSARSTRTPSSAWTSGRTVEDVERTLQAAGVPVHGVQNSAACWADPQLQHRGHYLTVDHPVHDTCIVEGPRVVAVTDARRRPPGRPDAWASTTTTCCAASSATTTTASPTSSSPAPSADAPPGCPGRRRSRQRLVPTTDRVPDRARTTTAARQVAGWPAALSSAAPTMPASFSSAAGTTSVSTSMCGSHLSALRLAPPPTITSSGESSLTTTSR